MNENAPGPPGGLLLGSTLDFRERPLQYLSYLADAYGDIVHFRVGFQDWYLLSNPEHVWDVTVRRQDLFHKPQLAKRLWKPFLGRGIITTDGADWKKAHKLIRPGFHRDRIEAYGRTMVEFTHRMLDRWEQGEQRDVHADLVALTLEIVAKTLFDTDVADDAAAVGEAMLVIQQVMADHIHLPLPLPVWWPSTANRRKVKALADIHGIVDRIILERRAEGVDHGDLLGTLLSARDDEGAGMDDRQIRDEAMTLFFAGHETSSNALAWAWYLLSKHPEAADRCAEEVRGRCGDRAMEASDLRQLPYLDRVVKECMRILPSVWVFMREPIEDVPIGDFVLPKGCNVLISPWVLQHDHRWFPDPERFDPERFTKERESALPNGAFVPFAAGPRVCAGKAFAVMEMRLVLGTMLRRQVPTLVEGFEPDPVAELSLHPRGGLPIVVQQRMYPRPALRSMGALSHQD